MPPKKSPEAVVREIPRKTCRRYSVEDKIRIVLEGLKGETSVAELCRREGLSPNLYYNWSKEFLEAGKRRLMGDTVREATSGDVTALKRENIQLKSLVADLSLANRSQRHRSERRAAAPKGSHPKKQNRRQILR